MLDDFLSVWTLKNIESSTGLEGVTIEYFYVGSRPVLSGRDLFVGSHESSVQGLVSITEQTLTFCDLY